MVNIPPPPYPVLDLTAAYIAAGVGVVLGAFLLLWGRHLHRALLAAVGAAAGFLLAGPLAARIGAEVFTVRIGLVIVAAIVALVSARAIWALLGGAIAVGAATVVLKLRIAPLDWPDCPDIVAWLAALRAAATPDATLGAEHLGRTLLVLCPVAAAVLVAGMVLGRLMRILMTALLGAAMIVAGAGLALVQRKPALWPGDWNGMLVPGFAAAGLLLLGLVAQYRGVLGERREQRREEEEEEDIDEPQKGKTRKGHSADKKLRQRHNGRTETA